MQKKKEPSKVLKRTDPPTTIAGLMAKEKALKGHNI